MLNEVAKSDKTIHFYNNSEQDLDELSKQLRINKETLMFYPSWYNIDGELYYFKELKDIQKLVNELLGVHLAKFFQLDTVEYSLGMKIDNKDYRTGLLSKSVYDSDKEYKNLYDIARVNVYGDVEKDCINDVFDLCKTEKEKKKLKLQILKMSILDFYSHQVDRTYPNIDFQISPNVTLAPLYDYEETFDVEQDYGTTREHIYMINYNWYEHQKYLYGNDLLRITFPSNELLKLFEEYPDMYKTFIKILDLDIIEFLESIENDNNIDIPHWLLKHYIEFDNKQKEFVRKIK